jgi:uncharacterized membrane protein YjjP (DUF1212 family)
VNPDQAKFTAYAMKVLAAAVAVGEAMLRSRVPTSEVERSVRRFNTAFGLSHCEVSITMNEVAVSLVDTRLGAPMTIIKVVDTSEVRLDLLVDVESLIRAAESGEADLERTTQELPRIIAATSRRPWWINSGFYLLCVASWVVFAGGGWVGALAGVLGAIVIQLVVVPLSRTRLPDVFGVAIASAIAVAAPAAAAYFDAPIALTPAIVGGLYPLLPGGAIAASVTDWLAGMPLSAMAKGLQAALSAAGLALGAVGALTLVDQLQITSPDESIQMPVFVVAAAAALAVTFLALSRSMPIRLAPGAAIVTVAAWAVARAMPETSATFPPDVFVAAIVIGAGSQLMARIQRTNASVYTTTTVFVLAPGLLTYMAMVAATSGDTDTAAPLLVQALGVSGALAAGVALGVSLTRGIPVPRPRVRLPTRSDQGS